MSWAGSGGLNADIWAKHNLSGGIDPNAIDSRTDEQRALDAEAWRKHCIAVQSDFQAFKAWEAETLTRWEAVGQYVRSGNAIVPIRIGTDHSMAAQLRFIESQDKFGPWAKRVPCASFYQINQGKKYAFEVNESSDAKWAEEVCHGKWDGLEGKYPEVSLYRFVDDPDDEPWCMESDFAKRVKARKGENSNGVLLSL